MFDEENNDLDSFLQNSNIFSYAENDYKLSVQTDSPLSKGNYNLRIEAQHPSGSLA